MKNLKKLRKEKGLTQEELSNKTGIAISTIAMYELSNRNPTTKKAKQLADFFNVSIDYLLYGENSQKKFEKGVK